MPMNIHKYLLIAFIVLSANAFGQWTDHYSFASAKYATTLADKYIAGSEVGLFVCDNTEHQLLKVTKTNHLSSHGVSALASDGNSRIFVGYTNGDLDIVDLNEYQTTNIPDLKKSDNVDLRRINSLCYAGARLYCGLQSGILEVDLVKNEVKSYYRLATNTVNVNAIVLCHDSIYAATNFGLLVADARSRMLEDHNEWELFSASNAQFVGLAVVADSVVAVEGQVGASCRVHRVAGKQLMQLGVVPAFKSIASDGKNLLIAQAAKVEVYNASMELQRELTTYDVYNAESQENVPKAFSASAAAWGRNGDIVVADAKAGMVVCDADGDTQTYLPNGPANNFCFNIHVAGSDVYVTAGGITAAFDNRGRAGELYCYSDSRWTTATTTARDLLNVASDPNTPDSVYISSWGKGVVKVEDHEITQRFNAQNSALKDIFNGDNYIRVGAIAYDHNHNLMMSNASVDPGMLLKTPQNQWFPIDYSFFAGMHSTRNMIVTRNNNCWVSIPRGGYKGLAVYNISATPDNTADDVYRCVGDAGNDSRYCGPILMLDENGDLISDNIICMAEDLEGRLWFATDDGVVTYSGDKNVFDRRDNPVFNRIKVPRNDGTNLADYLLGGVVVNAIAVDGANRKWIATATDGIYLVSPDGLETIKKFTVDNSPLPTNEVVAVDINAQTGEVFIGTPYGVLSYISDAVKAEETLDNVLVYPNPVRPDYFAEVQIKGLMDQTQIKITDLAGRLVAFTTSNGGLATWNCCGFDGDRVATGVYLIWSISPDGTQEAVKKLTVIR